MLISSGLLEQPPRFFFLYISGNFQLFFCDPCDVYGFKIKEKYQQVACIAC